MKYDADITVVLDRSGSMNAIRGDTIGGFNTFLKDQKDSEGTARLTLVQFDDQYEVVHESSLLEGVADLTEKTFVPRGMTALYDAIGRTIATTERRINALPKANRPKEVIFVIITDGQENASQEFKDRKQIFDMINHRTEKDGWEFLYLGANQDAIKEAAGYGIKRGNSMSYAATSAGVTKTFQSVSRSVKDHRRGRKLSARFTSKERKDALEK